MANTAQVHGDQWKAAIDRAIPAVVTIHSAFPYSFDMKPSVCGEATGIIVDANLGIILTNRHVVGEAPMCGRAVFQTGARQCTITPLYIDPIHDFALCKFDVKDLHNLPLRAIELRPDLVEVGLEIRVLGNDAEQVMSILSGVISRVDCNPPHWDARKYRHPGGLTARVNAPSSDPLPPGLGRRYGRKLRKPDGQQRRICRGADVRHFLLRVNGRIFAP